jgi:hypothetical protein
MKYGSRLGRLERALPSHGEDAKLAPLTLPDLAYLADAYERADKVGDPSIARAFRKELRRKLRQRYAEGFRDYGDLPTGDAREMLYAIRDDLAASEAEDALA